jgi:hypothetical protein
MNNNRINANYRQIAFQSFPSHLGEITVWLWSNEFRGLCLHSVSVVILPNSTNTNTGADFKRCKENHMPNKAYDGQRSRGTGHSERFSHNCFIYWYCYRLFLMRFFVIFRLSLQPFKTGRSTKLHYVG